MLRLKLQYFGHLKRRADSMEKKDWVVSYKSKLLLSNTRMKCLSRRFQCPPLVGAGTSVLLTRDTV